MATTLAAPPLILSTRHSCRCGRAQPRGIVRAGDHLRSLADTRVTLVHAAGNVVGTTTTGPDGGHTFADLDARSYSMIAARYPPVTATVTVDGRSLEDVHLESVA